jgi:ankyrin repeat protein
MLLKRGSDINYVNSKGLTPLHYAIEANLPSKMIKFLLKNGADMHIKDRNGQDACDKSKTKERYANVKFKYNLDTNNFEECNC